MASVVSVRKTGARSSKSQKDGNSSNNVNGFNLDKSSKQYNNDDTLVKRTKLSEPRKQPLKEKKKLLRNTPGKQTQNVTKIVPATKSKWKIPAHSGVPLMVSKSPASSKGVTKPRSVTKKRKLPAHSGVPVSFSKKQMLFLMTDD